MHWMDEGLQGFYRDVLSSRHATAQSVPFRKNLITDRCRVLLAGFMAGAPTAGPTALMIGQGDAAWDDAPPAPADPSITTTLDPSPVLVPLPAGAAQFVDGAGAPTATPTRRIQIELELPPGTPPIPGGQSAYPMREFGLVGQFDGDPFLINYVRHAVIHKGATDTLVRTIRLVF